MRRHRSCLLVVSSLLGCAAAEETRSVPGEIYRKNCEACHGSGLADAPVFGNAEMWKPRAAKGMETLVDHVVNGFGTMPAKGGNPALSREDVASAVQYMAKNSR